MKTSRRGFFGALAGLASGVYAAFQKGKTEATVKPKLEPKDEVLYEPTHIQVTGTRGSTDSQYFEFTIWGITNEGRKLPLKYVKISEDGKEAEWDLV